VPQTEQVDNYKVLIATDAISEGYNLHRAGTIFNYDIPYNPMRVVQRIGRINRVNKKVFDELFIYNYFPSLIGERDTKVKTISTIKMRMVHAIMGGDMKVLTENEELFFSEFNKKIREAESLSEQKSWDTDFREEWEQAREQQTLEYQEALKIPIRSRIGRKNTATESGVMLFGKSGDECIFKFGRTKDNFVETLTPEEALPIFKTDAEERAYKVSDNFDALYQIVKNHLFKNNPETPNKKLSEAKSKVKAWKKLPANNRFVEYLELLQEVLELNAIPSYSELLKAKSCDGLPEKIPEKYLKRILQVAKNIDEKPETVIIAEEIQ